MDKKKSPLFAWRDFHIRSTALGEARAGVTGAQTVAAVREEKKTNSTPRSFLH